MSIKKTRDNRHAFFEFTQSFVRKNQIPQIYKIYAFTLRSMIAKNTCDNAAIGMNHQNEIEMDVLVTIKTANATQMFIQYKQPPIGLYNTFNGLRSCLIHVSKNRP